MPDDSLSDLNRINPPQPSPFKIYIACLTSHLEGGRYGVWVNAHQSMQALEQAAQAMLTTSPAGKKAMNWIILGAKGFDPLLVEETTPLETIARAAAFLTAYGKLGMTLLHHFSKNLERDALEKAQYLMTQHYCGGFKSKMDFIQSELTRVKIPLPEKASVYLTIEKIWFEYVYFLLSIDNTVHVFDQVTSIKLKA